MDPQLASVLVQGGLASVCLCLVYVNYKQNNGKNKANMEVITQNTKAQADNANATEALSRTLEKLADLVQSKL